MTITPGDLPASPPTALSTSLMTDMYELTMLQSALRAGTAERESVFELFGRKLPASRRFGVVAGTGRLLDAVESFAFTSEQIDFLHRAGVVDDATLDFLRDYRFRGTIRGYAEGECYVAGSPLLTVEGTFAEACIIETLALSIYNYDCAVASAASRMTIAAHGRPCADFGARRAHEEAAIAAARAAIVGGFTATSNLEAGMRYGIPTVGTSAHSFTLLHDSEEEAFAAQIASLGTGTTILVDTYDIAMGVERAVKAARAAGGELGAVRLDSGDLVAEAFKVRAQLDALGATTTRITVTNDLDEHAIAALGAAPVDSYGVGTKLVTGSGRPTAALVYKLVERRGADGEMAEVAKFSSGGKSTVGGRKWAGRVIDGAGTATEELLVSARTEAEGLAALAEAGARPLQVPLVVDGEIVEEHRGEGALAAAAERHQVSRAELPYEAWRLSDGDAAIPTRYLDLDGRTATRR
ncbi:nicotinate phosphoribosyltransferase [Actinomyces gaoshouyii]|uniref:Nicotinate phosphoribosyltransferase n=1 Tax=Actinomyces gaoshouyii TaxID=1960083 RepID=A0A8H9H9I4_9ACTO|nr:nicotinate phosphoribosyltransferase [Actinomyces gaoshouyii]GGO99348.1 nicotinate phosphoribosyltransferase [Actinomyces gaoshouyii]